SEKLTEVLAPLPSVAVMVTVRLSSGPSVVGIDHDHDPSLLSVTVPDDAVRVTGSRPLPLQVPVLVAVLPSGTVTVAWLTVVPSPEPARAVTSDAVRTPSKVAM